MTITDDQPAGYLFDNAAPHSEHRFASLEACYDALTQAQLQARGISPGWRCLEVGAGSGSIARWMAREVGRQGHVLATDIDTRWAQVEGLAQLEVRQHDVVKDELLADTFDLIHARLVLVHLPERDAVITRLANALKPGGWLVIEDFGALVPICLDPLNDDEQAFVKVGYALVEALRRRGAEPGYSATLPHRLATAGLDQVGASGQLTIYTGASAQSRLQVANIDQVGDLLIQAGLITAAERDTFRRLLDDPSFVGNHPLLITAWGRKPPGRARPGAVNGPAA